MNTDPYHIHRNHFYVLGQGFGTFDATPGSSDINSLNYFDPMRRDTVTLPAAIACQPSDPAPCYTNVVGDIRCNGPVGAACIPPATLTGKSPSWVALRVHFDFEGPIFSHW